MRTFFDTRLEELGPNGFVYTECKCGRNDLLTRGTLKQMGGEARREACGCSQVTALSTLRRARARNDIYPSGEVNEFAR